MEKLSLNKYFYIVEITMNGINIIEKKNGICWLIVLYAFAKKEKEREIKNKGSWFAQLLGYVEKNIGNFKLVQHVHYSANQISKDATNT